MNSVGHNREMMELDVDRLCLGKTDRFDLWATFLNEIEAKVVAEIGVFRGLFAAAMLERCPSIETYYMIDPWRHLDDWNKPANVSDAKFDAIMSEALERTNFAASRVKVLRGRTQDVVGQIADQSLDFAYIDADHSLRGITIDLQLILPKIRPDGSIGGDDFSPNVWQHAKHYEPSLVFPYAIYFAEAMKLRISALGFNQFLMHFREGSPPVFSDHTGQYPSATVLAALEGVARARRRGGVARRLKRVLDRR